MGINDSNAPIIMMIHVRGVMGCHDHLIPPFGGSYSVGIGVFDSFSLIGTDSKAILCNMYHTVQTVCFIAMVEMGEMH